MTEFLTGYPITKAKLDEILDLIEAGENVTSLWMPMSSRTDFAMKLQTKDGLGSDLAEKVTFIYLDLTLSQIFLERQLDESLGRYSDKSGVRNKLVNIVESGKRLVLILDNFSLENVDWVKYILSLRHEVPPGSVTFLLLAFESEFYAKSTSQTDFGLIYHNIVKVPYLTRDETLIWMKQKADELGYKFNDREIEQVFVYCGGIYGLLINFFRAYRRFRDIKQALESEQMQDSVKHLWGRFSERERHVLKSVVSTGRVPPYTFEINYMKTHNLLAADNKIIGEWVKSVVGTESEEEVKMNGAHLEWNGVDLNEMFTDKENLIFGQLVKNTELSRDEVAKLLWKNEAVEKYSDWAIDQLFSRIRKKLDNVGLGGERVKTVKGRGFKVEGIKID